MQVSNMQVAILQVLNLQVTILHVANLHVAIMKVANFQSLSKNASQNFARCKIAFRNLEIAKLHFAI